jgi:GT2 family glycosyltransferase
LADKKSISVIIPNYNGRYLLEKYLPFTIAVLEQSGALFEIIVVDDTSKDESVSFMRDQYPGVKLIVNGENKGFSYTCNRGIDAAQNELILLLNSDVKLEPGYFDHLWKYFSDDSAFGVMGRIIDMDGNRIQDAARVPKFNGLKLKTDYFYYTNNIDDRLFTLYLSGANALIDAAKLKELDGFNELFSPFYSEDMELSLRAWRLGWKCYYEHQAVCRHEVSASTKSYKTTRWVKSIYFRNRFYFHAIHLDGLWAFLYYCQITLTDLLPKLLIGKWWIWKSYAPLFKRMSSIRESKTVFNNLMHRHNSRVTIFDVVRLIRLSVKGKKMVGFKP